MGVGAREGVWVGACAGVGRMLAVPTARALIVASTAGAVGGSGGAGVVTHPMDTVVSRMISIGIFN